MKRTVSLLLFVLLSVVFLTSCNSDNDRYVRFIKNANGSSGSYWEYELDRDDIIRETEYKEDRSFLNFGPGYRQKWTFEIIGQGEVRINWIAYEGGTYSQKDSFTEIFTFDEDGNYSKK